jgi:recombinational DNA repair protein RecT
MDIKSIITATPERIQAVKYALAASPTRPDFEAWLKALAIMFTPVQGMSDLDAVSAVMRMATLGMDPSPASGHVYLIKRGGAYKLEEGYKFRLHLLHLAGWTTETNTVNEGEDCKISVKGGMCVIDHTYSLGRRGEKIEASYAITERTVGGKVQRFVALVDNNQMDRIRDNKNAWEKGPEAMAKKAAIHRLRHTMPIEALGLSAAAASALAELDAAEIDGITFLPPSTPTVSDAVSMVEFYELYEMTLEDIEAAEADYPDPAERMEFIKNNFDLKGVKA